MTIHFCNERAGHSQPYSNLHRDEAHTKNQSQQLSIDMSHADQLRATSGMLRGVCRRVVPDRSFITFTMLSLLTILTSSVESASLHIMHHILRLSLGPPLPCNNLIFAPEAFCRVRVDRLKRSCSPSMHRHVLRCHNPCTDYPAHLSQSQGVMLDPE